MSDQVATSILRLTVKIVSAHISRNQLGTDALPSLIRSVYRSLSTAGDVASAVQVPAVPIKKSVFPDYLVCLEDGKRLKLLRRYLRTSYNLTPEAYRAKWGLPANYPMVAPSYAAVRSTVAKKIGLGRKPPSKLEMLAPTAMKLPARRAKGSKA